MLAKELNSMEKGISNLLSAIEQGMVTSFTKKRLEKLEGRQECSRKPFKCSFTSKKAKEKSELNTFQVFNSLSLGGENEIRTHGPVLAVTRSPEVTKIGFAFRELNI